MKKNKLLYILTILITLFTFNMNVKANNVVPKFEIKNYGDKATNTTCQAFYNLQKDMGYFSIMLEEFDATKYNMTCTYSLDISYESLGWVGAGGGNLITKTATGCHIIQFSINENGNVLVSHSLPGYTSNIESRVSYFILDKDANGNSNFFELIKEKYNGMCPQTIYSSISVTRKYSDGLGPGCYHNNTCTDHTEYIDKSIIVSLAPLNSDSNAHSLTISSAIGYNLNTGEYFEKDYMGSKFIGDEINILNCENLFVGAEGEDLLEIIKWVIQLVKIAIPILLIGLGIIDFAKAVFSGKEDDMKKAQEKFMKRVIIGVCIYLIPTLITYILKLYNLVWDKKIDTDFCGILK